MNLRSEWDSLGDHTTWKSAANQRKAYFSSKEPKSTRYLPLINTCVALGASYLGCLEQLQV